MTTVETDPLGELADVVARMSPEQLEAFARNLDDPADLELLEAMIGRRRQEIAGDWRANPATMAAYLTGGQFRLWPYFVLLGEAAAAAFHGEDPHQLWMLPSQYGKTSTLMWTAIWALDEDPTRRLMYVSYDANRAVDEGGKALDLARQHAGDLRFRLRPDRRAKGAWQTDQGGGLYCTGIGGAITGFPEDAILCDDLIKGWQAAHSDANRDTVWNVYRSQIRMRVQSSENPIIVAGTRWHEDDPQHRLIESATDPTADQWSVIRLPATAEPPDPGNKDPLLRVPDPLGREPGQVLEPRRFPPAEVDARRAVLGPYLWAAMEQQRPAPVEGGELKRAWWRLEDSMPVHADEWITSWDLKMTDRESGSYVVGQAWARTGSDFWCVDQLRGQWNQPTAENAIALLHVRHPQITRHLIEYKAKAPEVVKALETASEGYEVSDDVAGALGMTEDERARVNELRRRGMPGLKRQPTGQGSKVVRARAVSGYIESGHAHLPRWADWLAVFLDEASSFPNGANDDQVDTMSQALAHFIRGGPASITPARGQIPSTRATGGVQRGGPMTVATGTWRRR